MTTDNYLILSIPTKVSEAILELKGEILVIKNIEFGECDDTQSTNYQCYKKINS